MLNKGELEVTARLARLSLVDGEKERLGEELSTIVEMVESLAQVPCDGVPPMTHAVPMTLRLRADQPAESLSPGSATAAAADADDGMFRVPAVLGES